MHVAGYFGSFTAFPPFPFTTLHADFTHPSGPPSPAAQAELSLPFNTSPCCLPSTSQQVSLHSPLFFGSTSLLLVLFGRGERLQELPAVVWVQLFGFLLHLFWFVFFFFLLLLFCCGLSSTSEQRTLLCNRAGELCMTSRRLQGNRCLFSPLPFSFSLF